MAAVQEWGRKESIIWPPRGFYYTYGAIFLAVVLTGFLMYVHFHFSLSPLEEYYLPYYIRTETAGVFRRTGMYQLVYITDGKSQSRVAMEADVSPGQTWQSSGKPLPLVLSDHALQQGFRSIFREVQHPYQNNGLHAWLGHWIYAETSLPGLFATPFCCGLLALSLQLPFSIRKDIKRRKELRYGRRSRVQFLAGPIVRRNNQGAVWICNVVSCNGTGSFLRVSDLVYFSPSVDQALWGFAPKVSQFARCPICLYHSKLA